jgi:EAL domain-containing protein (putative c-di-GMP-specific phosphodiesterase class I)
MINDIHSAMQNQEFSLHYQPIIDLVTKKITSAETLLRWNHPKLGFISLNKFLPLAEESGLIREIGLWVVKEVASNLQHWDTLGLPPLQISLNQSVAEYGLSKCHIEWLKILNNKQIPLNTITFEITEKIFSNENINYLNSIRQLKQAGIRISLDGFGTGSSSLNYLKKFPLDVIKIDRSYIHSMIDDPTHAIFVETIILLANKLGIKIIATGIETQQQLALLNSQCRYVQGNYFSKPLPFIEFIKSYN